MSLSRALSSANEEAAHWLFRHQNGLSEKDEAEFEAWRAASDENARAWVRAETMWREIDAEDDPVLDAMRSDALSARPVHNYGWRRGWIAAAAALVVGLFGGVVWKLMPVSQPGSAASVASTVYSTEGAQRTFVLADGSQTVLDRQTALKVTFDALRRNVTILQGRAYFEVKHDGRSFAVAARNVVVTATGTRFAIDIRDGNVSTTLEEGRVVVVRQNDPSPITLQAGQTVVAVPGQAMVVSAADAERSLAWSQPYVEFRDTPLSVAVGQIETPASSPIYVIGRARKLKVNGRFRKDDLSGFIAAVTAVLPVRHRPDPAGGIDLVMESGF